jgi:hypothetical protein
MRRIEFPSTCGAAVAILVAASGVRQRLQVVLGMRRAASPDSVL